MPAAQPLQPKLLWRGVHQILKPLSNAGGRLAHCLGPLPDRRRPIVQPQLQSRPQLAAALLPPRHSSLHRVDSERGREREREGERERAVARATAHAPVLLH